MEEEVKKIFSSSRIVDTFVGGRGVRLTFEIFIFLFLFKFEKKYNVLHFLRGMIFFGGGGH